MPVPYRYQGHPTISKWELRSVKERLRKEGEDDINEDKIFKTREEIEEEIEMATKNTRSARRQKQRKKDHLKSRQKKAAIQPGSVVDTTIDENDEYGLEDLDLEPRWRES